jgi:hypothetical protein
MSQESTAEGEQGHRSDGECYSEHRDSHEATAGMRGRDCLRVRAKIGVLGTAKEA